MRWLDEIVAAFHALGGAARYDDLYEYVSRTTDRTLSEHWKSIIRRNIEENSSDSLAFKYADLFRKFGHGHWGLREIKIEENELIRREALSSEEVVREIFVKEHWRSRPSERPVPDDIIDDKRLSPTAAWCTRTHLEVELASGTKISCPIDWYPRLHSATAVQRAKVGLSPFGLHWEEIDEDISIENILLGTRGIAPRVID